MTRASRTGDGPAYTAAVGKAHAEMLVKRCLASAALDGNEGHADFTEDQVAALKDRIWSEPPYIAPEYDGQGRLIALWLCIDYDQFPVRPTRANGSAASRQRPARSP